MNPEHICVCVCTFRRVPLLARLLAELEAQECSGLFTHSTVVIDNDAEGSARATVERYAEKSIMPVLYDIEPQRNISLARNRAVRSSRGDYIAFFDDDQSPGRDWLRTLYTAQKEFGLDGVLGPVKPAYDEPPPGWVLKGRFCERPTHATGTVIGWRNGRTGNVLLKGDLFAGDAEPFDQKFGSGGEDQDFFRRMMGKGRRFVWCNEAVAYEHIPPLRWRRGFLLRRALLRGKMSLRHPGMGLRSVMISLTAIPLYIAVLPVLALMGHHLFMKYLVKICDHLGRVLTAARIDVIPERYVVE